MLCANMQLMPAFYVALEGLGEWNFPLTCYFCFLCAVRDQVPHLATPQPIGKCPENYSACFRDLNGFRRDFPPWKMCVLKEQNPIITATLKRSLHKVKGLAIGMDLTLLKAAGMWAKEIYSIWIRRWGTGQICWEHWNSSWEQRGMGEMGEIMGIKVILCYAGKVDKH